MGKKSWREILCTTGEKFLSRIFYPFGRPTAENSDSVLLTKVRSVGTLTRVRSEAMLGTLTVVRLFQNKTKNLKKKTKNLKFSVNNVLGQLAKNLKLPSTLSINEPLLGEGSL